MQGRRNGILPGRKPGMESENGRRPASAARAGCACPGFAKSAAVAVTRLNGGRAKDIGAGTLLYDLVIGETLQVAIPAVGVLRTTPVRSVSGIAPHRVDIVTQHSTYRLRLRPE